MIANTLSITIAQRVREFATLRTIGGSRRQVLRAVMLEAFVVGAAASFVGLFLGLGIAKGLNALFVAIGVEFPEGGTVFSARTVIVSLRSASSSRSSRASARRSGRHVCRPSLRSARVRNCRPPDCRASGQSPRS